MNAGLETGTMVVSAIAMLGWLALNVGALRSHQLGKAKTIRYALLWLGIFALVVLVAGRFAA